MSASGNGDRRTFRSVGAWIAGWAWLVFVALNLIDLAARGRDIASLVATLVLLFGCALAYALLLRPRIVTDPAAIRVVNPLRTHAVPWPAVEGLELSGAIESITVVTGGTRTRAWALQSGSRARRRRRHRSAGGRSDFTTGEPRFGAPALIRRPRVAGAGGAGVPYGVATSVVERTHLDFVLEQLTELRATHLQAARRAEPASGAEADADATAEQPAATVSWAPLPAAALAGTGLAMLAAIATALLR